MMLKRGIAVFIGELSVISPVGVVRPCVVKLRTQEINIGRSP